MTLCQTAVLDIKNLHMNRRKLINMQFLLPKSVFDKYAKCQNDTCQNLRV